MGYSNISESLLEMHFFRLLVTHYKHLLGRNVHVFKPATTAEHWYGFDQAFFTSNASKPEVIRDLRSYISSGSPPRFSTFRAFLLQFKVVEIARKRSRHTPPGWIAPYYRAELYLWPNRKTGLSQHEVLRKLSGLPGASVAYVCPMIFDETAVLEDPRMSDLQFVDVASSPSGWLTAERHFILFQHPLAQPTWCSTPIPGKALGLEEVFCKAEPMSAQRMLDLLAYAHGLLLEGEHGAIEQGLPGYGETNILPSSLTIVAELPSEHEQKHQPTGLQ